MRDLLPNRRKAEDLAERLGTAGGLRVARQLQAAGLLDGPASPSSEGKPSRGEPQAIGIWKPREEGGERVFVRPPSSPLGDHYAARRVIRARRGRRLRVVYFGESAAAGYLYAPALTPAGVLEQQLGVVCPGLFEVVDLSRTNETLASMLDTVRAARQIEADVLVLFTGNNWTLLETPDHSPYAPSVRGRQRYAMSLDSEGPFGPVEVAAREVLERAAYVLAEIGEVARAASVPVLVVVPEVNLADWESRQPVQWLAGHDTARWHVLCERGRRLARQGRWEETIAVAERMLELDEGVCPTAYSLLALGQAGLGEIDDAVESRRREVASTHYANLAFLAAPRANPLGQDLLRRAAAAHGFGCVDLPGVFAEHTGSPLPGRRMFLDYCHLTVEGMKVAMAATTSEILRLLPDGADSPGWMELVARLPDPEVSAEADATAKFGAALHTAHRLLPVSTRAPLLLHWCRQALAASSGIASVMLDVVAARCAPCPAVLTAAQERLHASPYPLGQQHGWRWDHLDLDVIEAVLVALEDEGQHWRGDFADWLLNGWPPAGTELVNRPSSVREPLERLFTELLPYDDLTLPGLYRARWPSTSFVVAADGVRNLQLELTARLPLPGGGRGPRKRVHVELNGRSIGSFALDETWRRITVPVVARFLRPGANELVLRWPRLAISGEEATRTILSRLELGHEADLHPSFGEIYSLRSGPAVTTGRRKPLAPGVRS